MDENEIILRVGKILMEANEGECLAAKDYNIQLADIFVISPELGELCTPVIAEIVADELNHQNKLQALYSQITDIQAKKE